MICLFNPQLCSLKNNENVIRHFANTEQSCKLLLRKWKALKELVILLKIPYNATIEFQYQKLTLSDVYSKWVGMQLHLEMCITKPQFKSGLAKHLLDALKSRNENIFKNPFMVCALYLDPRYRNAIISNHEKSEEAQKTLTKIWHRINAIDATPNNDSTVANMNISSDLSFDDFDENEAVYRFHNPSNANNQTPMDIQNKITSFQPDSSTFSSILQYWESLKDSEPELYKLAKVVFSVPPTEVQIERDFSDLKWIFTERRFSLSQRRLEAILLLHLNKDLFYKISEKQVQGIQMAAKQPK